jgi:serine/threonine protein kinase
MSEQEYTCHYCKTSNDPTSLTCANCGNVLILLDRYRIVQVLGQGGFGVVYEVADLRLNRCCALKRVTATSLEEQQQIQNEADILARHASNLGFMPTIYDVWVEQAQTYMVMEYIDGPSLDQTVLPWAPDQVQGFLIAMLVNLTRLHAVRIIHRDIKPQNIKYTPHGRQPYMLLDFGIARQGTAMSVKAMSPDYAPPEQLQGLTTDARSDLYSLAATAYHMLTSLSPLQARAQAFGELPPLQQFAPDTPRALEYTLTQMLASNPDQRPPHARTALALLGRTPPETPQTMPLEAEHHTYQALPTIPVDSRRSRARHPATISPIQPPRTSYDTEDSVFFESMNDLAATFQDSPEAVGREGMQPRSLARPLPRWYSSYHRSFSQLPLSDRILGAVGFLLLLLVVTSPLIILYIIMFLISSTPM